MNRLVLLAAAVAVAASVSPAAAVGCPDGWYSRPTGIVNPLTCRQITHCWPMS